MGEIENKHTCVARLDDGPITSPANCPVCVAAVKARFDRQARALELLEACEAIGSGSMTLECSIGPDDGWAAATDDGEGFGDEFPDLPSALIAAARSLKGGSRG